MPKKKKKTKKVTKFMALSTFHVANVIRAVAGEPVEIKDQKLAEGLKKKGLIRELGNLRG